ncbi:hypothetical protein ABPG75_001261 [Micractinium tetrahymenae]
MLPGRRSRACRTTARRATSTPALLKEGAKKGEYVLVLDCDMIVHPDFLKRTVGHFYVQKPEGKLAAPSGSDAEVPVQRLRGWRIWPFACGRKTASYGANGKGSDGKGDGESQKMRWVPKAKAAFLQTPQDFWNVDASDPMVHCARFFYGPMLQDRDGIGAAPCCGTGVVFRRDVLVSIGDQAYGSITEDYNSAMTLMSAGMATMYLNERLSFGMAPDHIADVMTQRLRWAMGAIQILMKDNPLRLVAGADGAPVAAVLRGGGPPLLAFSTIFMALVPIVFLYSEVSPMVCAHLWEFAVVFGAWYLCNRLMMWHLHRGTEGGMQELWRGSQMWVWMAPNHVKAIWKVLVAENPIVKRLFNFEIGFLVTKKDKEQDSHAWQIMIFLSAISWGMLIVLCIWPAIFTMLPRVETEAGWKICWDPFEDPAKARAKQAATAGAPQGSRMLSFGVGSLEAGASHPRRLVRKSVDFLSSRLSFHWGGAGDAGEQQGGSSVGMQQASVAPASEAARPSTLEKATEQAPGQADAAPLQSTVMLRPAGAAASHGGGFVSPFAADSSSSGGSVVPTVHSVSLRSPSSAPFSNSSGAAGPFAAQALQPVGEEHAGADQAHPPHPPAHVAIGIPEGSPPTASRHLSRGNFSQALGSESAYSPAAELHRRRPLSNFGRVALRSRGDNVLTSSTLLTSMVLPERPSGAPEMVSVLLDAAGHAAPASPGAAAAAGQGRQLSHQLLPDLETLSNVDNGPAGTQQSVALPLKQLAALQYLQALTGAGMEPAAAPAVTFGSWRGGGGGAGAVASPFLAGHGTASLSVSVGQLPVISEVRLSGTSEVRLSGGRRSLDKRRSGKGMQSTMLPPVEEGQEREVGGVGPEPANAEGSDDGAEGIKGSSEASLVEELAREAQKEQAEHAPAGATPDRMSMVSRQLVDLAASLCPANASMLLDQGYSLAVPVVPATIYEHTLVARPNFRERESPASNWMFVIVNGMLLICLVVGSVLDVKMNKSTSDVTGTIGF